MSKKFKSWSWEYNEEREEITIFVQDCRKGWMSVATLSECPKGNMTDEEFDEKYNDLMTETIDNLGYESIWL